MWLKRELRWKDVITLASMNSKDNLKQALKKTKKQNKIIASKNLPIIPPCPLPSPRPFLINFFPIHATSAAWIQFEYSFKCIRLGRYELEDYRLGQIP